MASEHPLILRVLRIHQLIQAHRYPNIPDLAKMFDVSKRTIQRDIETLREQMGAPLAFNPIENGFEYPEEEFALPDVEMTEGELLALMVADTALAGYRGTEGEDLLRRLLAKAAVALPEQRTISPKAIAGGHSLKHTAPPAQLDPTIFATIEKSIRARETLELVHLTQSRSTASKQRFDPYHLASVDGEWYLVGFCHKRRQVRVLKPSRIRKAKSTGKHFLPRRFDPEEFLRTKIQTKGGTRIFEALLRFDSSIADHILEREWGAGYRVQALTSGGIELSFRAENADAVIRWCLGWGPGAEVISPPWVRRRARQILRQLGKRYEKPARSIRATRSDRRKSSK